MTRTKTSGPIGLWPWLLAGLLLLAGWAGPAQAIPAFNRQTGQNCVACHAGGQYPELTPYGRLFKLTGYTIGQRALPLSAMAVLSATRVANTSKSSDPNADFQKDGKVVLDTVSLLAGGKVTGNLGAFVQVTYDPYATQAADGSFHGHTHADNIDVRWADRYVSDQRDLIVGVSVNNNPSVSDPWNTAAAWMQYVPVPSPTGSRFIDGLAPYPGYAAGSNLAGITAYAFLNQTWYAELGGYRSANGAFSVLSAGLDDASTTKLQGLNPYWRLTWSRAWGAHNLMLGTSGMVSRIYDDPLNPYGNANVHRSTDLGLDAQYQYLLDPHTFTAQFAYMHSRQRLSDTSVQALQAVPFVDAAGNPLPLPNAADTTQVLRMKFTYTYRATYGASLGLFSLTGSRDTAYLTAGYDPGTLTITDNPAALAPSVQAVDGNRTGSPSTAGATVEGFYMPIQNLRLGAQYTAYSRFNGASSNFNGFGRNARDNNSLFLYAWAAY